MPSWAQTSHNSSPDQGMIIAYLRYVEHVLDQYLSPSVQRCGSLSTAAEGRKKVGVIINYSLQLDGIVRFSLGYLFVGLINLQLDLLLQH